MNISRRRTISPVWLIPVLIALVGLGMVIKSRLSAGPVIRISFHTADGLEAGKTMVRYRNVVIGHVVDVGLTADRGLVEADVALEHDAAPFTAKDTRFWVVRPKIGSQGISGLDTLLSGSFINVDPGRDPSRASTFVGLSSQPPVTLSAPGTLYTLHSASLGSMQVGSQVYYRRIAVGEVVGYRLSADTKSVDIDVFIKAPNDRFVTSDTRFWDTSGLDFAVGTDGVRMHAGSLSEVVSGGIEFTAREGSNVGTPAPANSTFSLFADRSSALAPDDGVARYVSMIFEQPLRGLSVGAPVEFHGVDMGKVVSVKLDIDDGSGHFPTRVGAVIYPSRLGMAHQRLFAKQGGESDEQGARLVGEFVQHGFRAQARTGSLLTGQLYVDLDFYPDVAPAAFNVQARPLVIPTIAGRLDKIEEQLNGVVATFSKLPFEQISHQLDSTVGELNKTLTLFNGQTLTDLDETVQEAQRTMLTVNGVLADGSPLQRQSTRTVQELQRTAASVNALTNLLGVQPQTVLDGLPLQAAPRPYSGP